MSEGMRPCCVYWQKFYLFTASAVLWQNELSFKDNKSAIFFRIGTIGYLAGFLAWFTWFLLATLNFAIYWLGYGYPNIMSGIFFQCGSYPLIVYGS